MEGKLLFMEGKLSFFPVNDVHVPPETMVFHVEKNVCFVSTSNFPANDEKNSSLQPIHVSSWIAVAIFEVLRSGPCIGADAIVLTSVAKLKDRHEPTIGG